MSLSGDAKELVLTGPLDTWRVTLRSGDCLTIWAHGVAENADHYVFVALMRGEPHFEIEVCRIPVAIVSDLIGG